MVNCTTRSQAPVMYLENGRVGQNFWSAHAEGGNLMVRQHHCLDEAHTQIARNRARIVMHSNVCWRQHYISLSGHRVPANNTTEWERKRVEMFHSLIGRHHIFAFFRFLFLAMFGQEKRFCARWVDAMMRFFFFFAEVGAHRQHIVILGCCVHVIERKSTGKGDSIPQNGRIVETSVSDGTLTDLYIFGTSITTAVAGTAERKCDVILVGSWVIFNNY